MLALFQIKAEGRALVIRKSVIAPGGIVIKGNRADFGEGDLPVDQDAAAGDGAALVGLTGLDRNGVVAVLRHFKLPLDPLAGVVPRITADVVEHGVADAVGDGRRGRAVIAGIQGRSGAHLRVFALKDHLNVLGFLSGGAFGGFLLILRVALLRLHGHEGQAPEQHRLVDGVQRQLVITLFKIELIGIHRIAHLVLAVHLLPVENLFLGRPDVVALVVPADLARVRPKTVKAQGGRAGKRNGTVDQQLTFNIHAAGRRGLIIHQQVIHAGLFHIYMERNGGAVGKQHAGFSVLLFHFAGP